MNIKILLVDPDLPALEGFIAQLNERLVTDNLIISTALTVEDGLVMLGQQKFNVIISAYMPNATDVTNLRVLSSPLAQMSRAALILHTNMDLEILQTVLERLGRAPECCKRMDAESCAAIIEKHLGRSSAPTAGRH